MAQHELVAVSLVPGRPAIGSPTLTVNRAPNPLATEFARSAVSQLGKAVVQIPQALLVAVLLWLLHRFFDR